MIWSTLEFPSFNLNSILDRFCILKGMSYMMPLSRHVLSLQTGLHRLFILGTVIPPTPAQDLIQLHSKTVTANHKKNGQIDLIKRVGTLTSFLKKVGEIWLHHKC